MMARPRPAELTGPVEDYLKAVYDIELGGAAATTSDLATRLRVAPASVSGMVRRLADQGLLAHEPYRGVRLTAAGRRAALRTLRRHRVIESYLTQALGYPWDRVHEEAERLEHAASDELIDRMAQAIGEPRFDPHGAPIPTRDGAVAEPASRPLAELAVGQAARVLRVRDDDPALLRYVDELTLRPGTRLTLVARAPYGGPLTVEVAGREQRIGPELAAEIRVVEE
jgi:DtxR family transcriptional regulator, Mn-dependent transcriptional regulator